MPLVGKFKAVLFDLGGTLIESLNPAEVHRKILEFHGVKVSSNDIAKAISANQERHDPREMAKLGKTYWVKWNLKILEQLGIEENREFLAEKIDELWFEYDNVKAYPDVIETIRKLKARGIRLGIVTNWLGGEFTQILRKLNLTDYFDVIVGADARRKAKPDKEIFLYAISKLRVRPEEAIFVGDSAKYDCEGARKAGLKPLLIDRNGRSATKFETITSLTELLKYV